jgi:hypothetical protein
MKYEPLKTSGKAAGTYWMGVVDRALRTRETHWNGIKQWKRSIDLFRGKHWKYSLDVQDPDSEAPRQRITVNKTGSIILSMLPFLVRKRPKFVLLPTDPAFLISSTIQSELLNYIWKEQDMNRQIKRAVLDMLVIGHGIVKTGFILELDVPTTEEQARTIDYRDYIKKEEPYASRVSPFNFIWDMDSCEKDLKSARWCAEIIGKSARDIISNKNYKASVRSKLKNGEIEGSPLDSMYQPITSETALWQSESDSEDEKWDRPIALIELWDKRSRKHFIFLHGHEEPLIEEDWPYDYLEDFPYLLLPGMPVIDDLYTVGVPKWIEDQQFELNRIRTYKFDHRRRFNRKYIADRNQVEYSDLLELKSGEDGSIVMADSVEAVKPIPDAPYPHDQDRVEGDIEQDMRELTGADELLQGGKLPSRTTATEIEARTRAIGFKIEDRIEDVDKFAEDVGRQILQHIKANYTKAKVIRISGEKGNNWIKFTPEDIRAEVEFEMESISAPRHNPDVVRQQASQVFQMILQSLPMLQQAGVQINIQELFKWLMEKFDNFKDTTRFVQQEAPIGTVMSPTEFVSQVLAGPGQGLSGSGPAFTVGAQPGVGENPASPQSLGNRTGGGAMSAVMGAIGR